MAAPVLSPEAGPATPPPPQRRDRPGTVEHLAARRMAPALNDDMPEVKKRLSELRPSITALVTGLRWKGESVQDTAERLIPLLNVGSLQQWALVLVPHILEIDRAGNLLPVWQEIIEREDPTDLPPDANPAETMIGRARRFAVLMLGNYKSLEPSEQNLPLGFSKQNKQNSKKTYKGSEIAQFLGKLAIDPNTSLYATQSLVKQGTTAALQALISALKDAEGWAKVDIVEACLKLNQPSLNELLLASGLDRANGLESYIAVPIYRSLPLERYLRDGDEIAPHLSQQAALIFSQILQDSMGNMRAGTNTLPIVFEGNLTALAHALFEGARNVSSWQHMIALHRLGLLLGRYWADISRGMVQDSHIVQPVYSCLPLMPEIERWMDGPGRDVLLAALESSEEEAFTPTVKVLTELRDPRTVSILLAYLDAPPELTDREQAVRLGQACDTLGRIGDSRVIPPMLQLGGRVLNVEARAARPKRRDNLVAGDPDIPGSVVYVAVIRAFGQLNDRNSTLDFIVRAANDFAPYVRTQAFEALKLLGPTVEDMRSRTAVRAALNDPRDTVVRVACQLAGQYHDTDAIPALRHLLETRPELAPLANNALRQLGQ